ncbi:MAG TPA: hypothetical protein PL010_14470, partial [Flavobacteriales bacterium]|nr:hypothetical protein [Flavobacteriales bacterium]
MRPNRRLLTYALALAVPLCTWAQTETEPNNNWNQNNPVAEGSSMSGSIGVCSPTDNSADWYALNLTQLGQLKINTSMSNDGPTSGVPLVLYDQGVNQIASFNLTSGVNGASALDSIFFTCRGTGTYYLRIDAPGGCLSYTFSYSVVQPVFGADNEDNDNWNTANTDTVAVNTNADGRIRFSQNDDNSDYHILTLNDDGILNVHIQAEHVDASTQDSLTVRLFDSGTNQLKLWRVAIGASSTPLASTVSIPCRGDEQRYFLQFSSDACGTSYRFSYDVTPPFFADDNEDNDNWNTANTDTVDVGADQDGRLNFYYDDNSDFHILTLDDDGILNIHIQAEHVDASTQDSLTVRLYDSNVNQIKLWRVAIGASSTPLASTVGIPCRGDEQRYFLQFSSDACGTTYRFSYDVTPPVFADDNENNDNWNTANTDTVAVSTDADGRLNFYYDDNSDYHILTLDDDGILNVHIQAEHVDASTQDSLTVRLYDSGTNQLKLWRVAIGASSTPLASTVSIPCRGNEQRYFLQLASDACGTTYRFSYDVTPPVFADDNENNDNWNTANTDTVDVGADQDGRLNFFYDDNSDFHILTLDDDGILNIHIQSEQVDASTGDSLTVRLYDNGVNLQKTWRVGIGANSTALDSTVHITCRGKENRYFLQFASDACGTSYRFSYDVTSPFFADDNEENDNWNSANTDTIFLDSAAVTGRLAFFYDDNSDFYKIHLATAGPITVDSRAENADAAGTYEVRLYNSGVNQIGTHTFVVGGSSTPASESFTYGSYPAGLYYLQATGAPCGTSYSFLCNDEDDDGVCNGFDLCAGTPNGEGVNVDGCSCSQVTVDDGDPCTLDECLNGDVTHTLQDADGDLTCDANDGCPNDPDKIAAGQCGCGAPDTDTDADGTADCVDPCPALANLVNGDACDDGNPNTSGDVVTNCICAGTLANDCEGVPGGPAQPGTGCDDNDIC